jgi:hypothetical protein
MRVRRRGRLQTYPLIPWVLRLVSNVCDHLLGVHCHQRTFLLSHRNRDSHAIRRCALYQFHTRATAAISPSAMLSKRCC